MVLSFILITLFLSASADQTSSDEVPHMVYVSSASSEWYRRTQPDFSHTIIDPEHRPDHELRLYHEDELPNLPNVTMIKLFEAVPWLEHELTDQGSGLNKYYELAQYFDVTAMNKEGSVKVGCALLMKVAAIQHAIHISPENSLVFWVDTDVSFRAPIPAEVLRWLHERDVTYIPFQLKIGHLIPDDSYLASNRFDPTVEKDLREYLHFEYWSLETGLFVFKVNSKTKAFIDTVVSLYRGGMYNLCLKCYRGDVRCRLPRYRLNLFLNDIFAFNLVLQSDIHRDPSFHVGLKHGWFAMHGYPAWDKMVWGNREKHYIQHLVAVNRSDSLVTNFYIGEYVFHHFGTHRKGGLAAQLFNREDPRFKRDSWKRVTKDILDYRVSLLKFVQECIHVTPKDYSADCKNIVERAHSFSAFRPREVIN